MRAENFFQRGENVFLFRFVKIRHDVPAARTAQGVLVSFQRAFDVHEKHLFEVAFVFAF